MGPDSTNPPIVILVPKDVYVTGMTAAEARGVHGVLVIGECDLTPAQLLRLEIDKHRDQLPAVLAYQPTTGVLPEEEHKVMLIKLREETEPITYTARNHTPKGHQMNQPESKENPKATPTACHNSPGTTASGGRRGASMPQTGDVITLPLDWTLRFETVDRNGEDFVQGFVFAPDGRESASLAFALDSGMTSGDREIRIPSNVLRELAKYEEEHA